MAGEGGFRGAEMPHSLITVGLTKVCLFGEILYAVNLRSVISIFQQEDINTNTKQSTIRDAQEPGKEMKKKFSAAIAENGPH